MFKKKSAVNAVNQVECEISWRLHNPPRSWTFPETLQSFFGLAPAGSHLHMKLRVLRHPSSRVAQVLAGLPCDRETRAQPGVRAWNCFLWDSAKRRPSTLALVLSSIRIQLPPRASPCARIQTTTRSMVDYCKQ